MSVKVLEIPMRWSEENPTGEVPDSERCTYIRPGERRCEARAVFEGMCGIHSRWNCWVENGWPIVCPEDRESIREVLRQTLNWMAAGLVTPQQAHAVVAICRAILKTL
jgi:hypothetical protein